MCTMLNDWSITIYQTLLLTAWCDTFMYGIWVTVAYKTVTRNFLGCTGEAAYLTNPDVNLHKEQFHVIRLVIMSSSPNDYLWKPIHITLCCSLSHNTDHETQRALSCSHPVWFQKLLKLQPFFQSLMCHFSCSFQNSLWVMKTMGLADEYNAYLENKVQNVAWLIYTGYDVETNTNWHVFLLSFATNTMRERYSAGGRFTPWWTPE